MSAELPEGLIRAGGTPEFTQDTIPAGLLAAHALAPGRWGVLQVSAGALVFVDEATGEEELISAPDRHVIMPEMRHHVRVSGPVTFRIAFYRTPSGA